jgi:signal transduction histidine kinase
MELPTPIPPEETFIQEMKRYLHFTQDDVQRLLSLSPRMQRFLPEMAERFYSQIPHHPGASRVFTGGEAQIARLKETLQAWGQGLFNGMYDERYARERFEIGYRHVLIGLDQKYVISAMGVVRSFLTECLLQEFPISGERLEYSRSLGKILDLDLNLICDSYFRAAMDNLRLLNQDLERATIQLSEASGFKDDFLAQVSHDLRTPLNSILGFTKLVLDGHCVDPAEEKEVLRDVFSSAQLLLRLVNDLLDISCIEAGKLSLNLEDVDPRAVLDSTLPLVALQAAAKGLRIVDETLDLSFPLARTDEVRLRQVLLNLLSNAVKFTAHGSITIRAIVPAREGFLRLEVHDTGSGIPPERRQSMFEKFVRSDGPSPRGSAGAGLGLPIAKRLVELMGGAIGLESGPGGVGSVAWFTVPIALSESTRGGSAAS